MPDLTFFKEIPSDPELLPELDSYLIDIAQKVGMNEDHFNNLSLSFSEAASNSIVHGNKLNPDKKVFITIKVTDSQMIIIIKDEGETK